MFVCSNSVSQSDRRISIVTHNRIDGTISLSKGMDLELTRPIKTDGIVSVLNQMGGAISLPNERDGWLVAALGVHSTRWLISAEVPLLLRSRRPRPTQ